jgi:hypothetical protein
MKKKLTIINSVAFFFNPPGRWYQKGNSGSFVCSNITEINNKIIPFFNKYPLMGLKLLSYKDWCKAAEIIKGKGHLTSIGLDMIIKIKAAV